jgi:hypothetical protein
MAADSDVQRRNKELVSAGFERWRNGTGSPFELLATDATWTMAALPQHVHLVFQKMNDDKVIDVIAFFDTKDFDAFWTRGLRNRGIRGLGSAVLRSDRAVRPETVGDAAGRGATLDMGDDDARLRRHRLHDPNAAQ